MKSIKNRNNYENAFKLFSKSDNFEIKEYFENGPMLVKFNNNVYKIYSDDDMYNHFKESLTDVDMAMHIPLEYWIEVAEEVHNEDLFIENLVQEIYNRDHFEELNYAINISNQAGNSASVFWTVLHNLSDTELYPKAITVSAKIYDLDSLLDELMEDMIADGENTFVEMKNGIFESIHMYVNTNKECTYYIFTADPIIWDI